MTPSNGAAPEKRVFQPGKGSTEAEFIRLDHVEKYYGDHHVLNDICLSVAPGEVVVIVGRSGSGKSTLLRCVNHLEKIDSGTIYIDGAPAYAYEVDGRKVVDSPRRISQLRAQVGMVFQRFNLFQHMTALENVMEAPVHVRGSNRSEARDKALSLLAKVGLHGRAHYYPEQLSGGEQQRVAIARALAMEPLAMLFDEVTSALDPELVGEVLAVMRQLAGEGMTMLTVTHEIRFGAEIADRAVFMEDGRIVEVGPASILRRPQSDRMKQFIRAVLRDKDED